MEQNFHNNLDKTNKVCITHLLIVLTILKDYAFKNQALFGIKQIHRLTM